MAAPEIDRIDAIVGQWAAVRPDLDVATMGTAGRLMAVARAMEAAIAALAKSRGLGMAEGDIVFALRRSGPPHRLAPSEISATLIVPSGTLTSRLDRLEQLGLIHRVPHPTDRRSLEVELTESAVGLIDAAVTEHVADEQRMLAALSARERAQLDRLMRKLLAHLEGARDDAFEGAGRA